MIRTSRIAKLFAAAGIAFGGVLSADAVALAKALESDSSAAINEFISTHSDSEYIADAIIYLAAKGGNGPKGPFKEPGDKGRPDIFGPPGKPVIGPPGQYIG